MKLHTMNTLNDTVGARDFACGFSFLLAFSPSFSFALTCGHCREERKKHEKFRYGLHLAHVCPFIFAPFFEEL